MIIIYSLIVYKDVIVHIFQNQHCIQNTLSKKTYFLVLFIIKKESTLPKRYRKYRLITQVETVYIQDYAPDTNLSFQVKNN